MARLLPGFHPDFTRISPANAGANNGEPCSTRRWRNMAHTTRFSVPLDRETRSVLPTPEAAYHLNRAQQTLRLWAMRENGPIRPLRVNGRLAWPVSELRRVLQVQAA